MNRDKIIDSAVKNLQDFGFKDCNKNNIFTDNVYRAFFKQMLEDSIDNKLFYYDIRKLIKELDLIEGRR